MKEKKKSGKTNPANATEIQRTKKYSEYWPAQQLRVGGNTHKKKSFSTSTFTTSLSQFHCFLNGSDLLSKGMHVNHKLLLCINLSMQTYRISKPCISLVHYSKLEAMPHKHLYMSIISYISKPYMSPISYIFEMIFTFSYIVYVSDT